MITLAEIQAYVGPVPAETTKRERGDALETSWPRALDGREGRWHVLTRGQLVIALWWTDGSRRAALAAAVMS